MIESIFTSPAALGLSAGLVVTIVLGFLCGPFIEKSVTIEFPNQFEDLRYVEKKAGGAQLGTLERLVFFAALWLPDAYVISGGWLVFKLGAKWAAWQHVAKIPEKLQGRDDCDYALEDNDAVARKIFERNSLQYVLRGSGLLCREKSREIRLLVSRLYLLVSRTGGIRHTLLAADYRSTHTIRKNGNSRD